MGMQTILSMMLLMMMTVTMMCIQVRLLLHRWRSCWWPG